MENLISDEFMQLIKVLIAWGGYALIYLAVTALIVSVVFYSYCKIISNKKALRRFRRLSNWITF